MRRDCFKTSIRKLARTGALLGAVSLTAMGGAFAQEVSAPIDPTGDFVDVPAEAPAAASVGPVCETAPSCDAEEEAEAWALQSIFTDACGTNWLDERRLFVRGWLDQGVTFNGDRPASKFNGPVTFNDRSNEYQMNQLYLQMGRAVNTEGDEWDIGGQVDLMYGTDYFFTTSRGLETRDDGSQKWNDRDGARGGAPLYGLAMPQLYAEIFAPIGNGVTIKAGHFYTIIGYEVVTAPQNFFYSHAYTMQYGEPFTHTGILASTPLGDKVVVSGGITQGWDTWSQTSETIGFLGGVTWTNECTGSSLAFALTTGDDADARAPLGANSFSTRTMYSIVYSQKLGEKWNYVLQHDHGFQENGADGGLTDAEWYGINNYLFYDINEKWKAGLRAEWFRDDDGVRVPGSANGTNFYEVSAGLNWRPTKNLIVRPELRADWADGNSARPYDDGTDNNQFLAAFDVIFTF